MTDQAEIVANVDKNLDTKEFKFRFKKDKLGVQRPTVVISNAKVPSIEGIIEIIQTGGKGLEMLQETVSDVIRTSLAGFVGDNEGITEDQIDWSKFSWDAIANQPRAERKTIDEETWQGFVQDYLTVMPAIANKSPEAVQNATIVYLKKFAQVKTNKEALNTLKDQLSLYIEHSKNAEQYQDVLDLLVSKLDTYLKADDITALISNL